MATGNSGNVDFTASNQGGNQVLRVHWVETYDIATWSSTVTIDHVYFSTTSWTGYTYKASFEILVNGQSALSINEDDGYTCAGASGTLTEILKGAAPLTGSVSGIAHNADGSKSTTISIRASADGYTYPGLWTSYTTQEWVDDGFNTGHWETVTHGVPNKFTNNDSKSIQLYTIAAASTISASSGTFGGSHTITISRQSSGVKHTIDATCLGQSQNILTDSSTYPTVTWTVPANWMNYIPNAQSATCTITCTTLSNGVAVGTYTISVTMSVAGANPSPTIAWAEPTGQTHVATYGNLVQGQSRVEVTVTPGTQYNATVASVAIGANGSTYYPTSSPYTATTTPLAASGNNTLTATVRDSRGLNGSNSATISGVLPYASPALTAIGVHRCDADFTPNDNGTNMYISYTGVITSLNSRNAKTVSFRYKRADQPASAFSAWVDITMAAYTETGTLPDDDPIDISSGIAVGMAYDVEVKLTDGFGAVVRSTQLSTVPVTMDFNDTGDGVAFGGVSSVRTAVDFTSWNVIGRVKGLGRAAKEIPQMTEGAYTNWNDLVEPGVYGVWDSSYISTYFNCPSSSAGILTVTNTHGDNRSSTQQYYTVSQMYEDIAGVFWYRYGIVNPGPNVTWQPWRRFYTLIVDERTITTDGSGYYQYTTDYPRDTYMIQSIHTVNSSDTFVRITGSSGVTGQWVRVLKADGTGLGSTSVKLRATFIKL